MPSASSISAQSGGLAQSGTGSRSKETTRAVTSKPRRDQVAQGGGDLRRDDAQDGHDGGVARDAGRALAQQGGEIQSVGVFQPRQGGQNPAELVFAFAGFDHDRAQARVLLRFPWRAAARPGG